MAEEQNTPDISEFEAKSTASSSNKDVWLFLIIIDVVLLCVFGFFLYKNLSVKLLSPATQEVPAVTVEETLVVEEEPAVPAVPVPVKAPVNPLPAEEGKAAVTEVPALVKEPAGEPAKETVKPETETIVKAPAANKPAVTQKAVPAEKKQSVIVQANPNSKYRQVTFRYFGPAKEVAVVSGFTMTKPRAMVQKNGVWETTLSISPGTYKYLLVVDGQQQPDPYAPQKDGRSVLVVE